ncbi:hypothetical protein S83_037097 [Arachis hypogaea]|nr:uncharacterized protein DS421_11g349610 [Arachis hypogaea]
MADNNDNIDEVPTFPPPSLAAKATFSRRSSTCYSSSSKVTFTAGDPTEPALPVACYSGLNFRDETPPTWCQSRSGRGMW